MLSHLSACALLVLTATSAPASPDDEKPRRPRPTAAAMQSRAAPRAVRPAPGAHPETGRTIHPGAVVLAALGAGGLAVVTAGTLGVMGGLGVWFARSRGVVEAPVVRVPVVPVPLTVALLGVAGGVALLGAMWVVTTGLVLWNATMLSILTGRVAHKIRAHFRASSHEPMDMPESPCGECPFRARPRSPCDPAPSVETGPTQEVSDAY